MAPYRSSIAARILLLSAALALIGGGIGALVGLPSYVTLSGALLPAIVGGLFGLGLGIEEHPTATAAMTIALPFALFAYMLVLQMVIQYAPRAGIALIAVGVLPLVDALITPIVFNNSKKASPPVTPGAASRA
jgi:hypothetical protein